MGVSIIKKAYLMGGSIFSSSLSRNKCASTGKQEGDSEENQSRAAKVKNEELFQHI
jgi:hypothetical protein